MIDRVVELVNELNEIVDTYRLSIEVDCLGRNKVLVLNKNEFFNQFTEFDIDYQNDQEYPYKASIEIDGVYFFTMFDQETYEKVCERSEKR